MMRFKKIAVVVVVGGLVLTAAGQATPGSAAFVPSSPTRSDSSPAVASRQFLGSVSSEKLHPGTMNLSFEDALRRGLKVNLGLFVSSVASDRSRAERWRAVSELLPHLDASVRESAQRINLRALGIPLQNIPRTVNVSNSDARLHAAQSLLDLSAVSRTQAASFEEKAAGSDYRDARETVVIAVSNAYLSVATAQARVEFAEADLKSAETLYQLARDRENAGLNPEVDTLRAQVEWQARQESLIEAKNALAKQTIVLLRLLGLNIHQPVRLTSNTSFEAVPVPANEVAYQQALQLRQDYRSAQEQLQAAESSKRAAEYQRAPRVGVVADYGALGTAPGNAVSTWNVAGVLRLPLFEGGRIRADVTEADSVLRQRRAEVEDTRARIAQEVENALLDLKAAKDRVEVAQSAVGYAKRALAQSHDRFAAGVTNNVEVIQAQEALASANEQWVDSLYSYNIARVLLARATGTAEASSQQLFSDSGSSRSSAR